MRFIFCSGHQLRKDRGVHASEEQERIETRCSKGTDACLPVTAMQLSTICRQSRQYDGSLVLHGMMQDACLGSKMSAARLGHVLRGRRASTSRQ